VNGSPSGARDLIGLSSAELAERVRDGIPGIGAGWVEALRQEAALFYHTDASAARKIAARALELAELLGDPLSLGWGHRAVAESLLFSGRMREADAAYSRAIEAWRRAKAPGLLGQLLVGSIHVLSLLGRHRDVDRATIEARRNLERAGDHVYLAKLAMNLGSSHFQHDRYGPALEEIERAAAIFRKLRIRDETVLGLEINRGVALSQLDRDEEALVLFERLDRETGRRGHEVLQAQVRMNAAYVHAQRADFGVALARLSDATTYFHQTEHPAFEAECLLNRGEIYHQLNLHQEALELAGRARPLFAAEGLTYDEGLALSQEALSSMALGDHPVALDRIRRGQRLFRKEQNAPRVALMDLLTGEVLRRLGRRAEAERKTRGAIEAFRQLGLVRWEAAAVVTLDDLLARQETPEERIPRLRDLLRRLPQRVYPIPSYRLFEALGRAEEQAGRTTAASRSYRSALTRLEDLRARIPTEESKIAFLGDKTHLYDRMLAIEVARSRPSVERLFEWMERARAQSLWDRLRDPGAYLVENRSGHDRRLTVARRRLAWLHGRISRLELGSTEQMARARRLRSQLGIAEQAWTKALREAREARAVRGASGQDAVPDLGQLRRELPKGWGFLEYHVGSDFAIALVATRDGVVWRRLADDLGARVARLADRLDFQWNAAAMASVRSAQAAFADGPPAHLAATRSAVTGPGVTEGLLHATADTILAELHGLLWAPLREMGLDPSLRWIVSPHGAIHRIPLHALRGGDGYVAERFDLAYAPSARVWSALPQVPSRCGQTAFVAGVPSAQLPAVRAEVEQICASLHGWTVQADLRPSIESLRREGKRAQLVHIAAHGMLRRDNPAYSFVELADGPLFVHDLAELRFPSSTVVLTACSSGRGAAPAGDEWIGLARGFLQAGARSVVASLWPIQDEPTLELMEPFYGAFAAGDSPPLALGKAMRALMARRPHPWHWASFASLGGVGKEPSR
jgi:tetratricopeptide (TPR) repeat protein